MAREAADYLQRAYAEESLRQSEADARLLQSIGSELVSQDTAQSLYERIVDAAASLLKSDFASMQALVDLRRAVDLGLELNIHATMRTFWKVLGHLGFRCSLWTVRSGGTRRS